MKKKVLSIMLAMVMILSLGFTQGVEAKGKKAIKLSSKSITVVVGNTKKVSIKNAGKLNKKKVKAIKWSAGKNVKVKVVGKKKTSCILTGVKKGKTVLKVKVKGKTLRCKVAVVEAKASSTAKEEQDNKQTTDSSKNEDKKNTSSNNKKDNKNNTSDNKSDTSKTDKNDTKHVHKYSEWSEVEPTCTEDGYKTRKCSGCGEVEKVPTGKEKLGHNEERTTKVAATCITGGTDLITCKRCKSVLREEATKELGHNWSDWSVKDATCTEDGLKSRNCTRCSEVQKEVIKAKGHVDGEKKVVQATCTTDGYTEVFCKVCKKSLRKEDVVGAYKHKKQQTVTSKVANWYEDGVVDTQCIMCGKILDSKKYVFAAQTAPNLTYNKITSNVATTFRNTLSNPETSFFAYYNIKQASREGYPMFKLNVLNSMSSGSIPYHTLIGVLRGGRCDIWMVYQARDNEKYDEYRLVFDLVDEINVEQATDSTSEYLKKKGKLIFEIGDNIFVDVTNVNKILAKADLSCTGRSDSGSFTLSNLRVCLDSPIDMGILSRYVPQISSRTLGNKLESRQINKNSVGQVRMGFMPRQGVFPEQLN